MPRRHRNSEEKPVTHKTQVSYNYNQVIRTPPCCFCQYSTTQHNTTHQSWTPTCTPSLWRRRSRSRRVSTGKTTFSSVQRRYRRCNRNRNYKHNSNLHRRPPPPPRKPLPLPLPHPRHQHLTRHGLNASSISLILTLACVSLRRPSITDR